MLHYEPWMTRTEGAVIWEREREKVEKKRTRGETEGGIEKKSEYSEKKGGTEGEKGEKRR